METPEFKTEELLAVFNLAKANSLQVFIPVWPDKVKYAMDKKLTYFYYSEAHKIISTDPNQCAGCESNTVMEEVTLREAKRHLSRMDGDGNHVVWHNTDISRPNEGVNNNY